MDYIHVKNLEKYHPGYRDRTMIWAKIYLDMATGDPECEKLDEIDFGRFIKIILLELRAKKALPNEDWFWVKKGFDIKNRPMSLTIQMLHNFLSSVSQLSMERGVYKIREDKSRVDGDGFNTLPICSYFYDKYLQRTGCPYVRNFGKDGAIFKELLKIVPEEELKTLIDRFFDLKDEFVVKAGFTVGVFKTQINPPRSNKPPKKDLIHKYDPDCKICSGTGKAIEGNRKGETCVCGRWV